jgi:hypothetical protein
MHDILLRSTESERKRAIFRVIDDEINASGKWADLWRLKDPAICVRISRRELVGCNYLYHPGTPFRPHEFRDHPVFAGSRDGLFLALW